MSSAGRIIFAVSVIFFQCELSFGQFKTSGFEFGINAGTLIYQGDLSPGVEGDLKSLRPALGLYAAKSLGSYFSVRANLALGKLIADESRYTSPDWKQHRNFKFSTPVTELSALLVFNPYGIATEKALTPYVFAGFGISFLNVKRDWSNIDTSYFDIKSPAMLGLAQDIVHPLPKVVAVLPVGAGIRYAINTQIDIKAEATYRFTSSDYLDGFGNSAGSEKRDGYYGLSLGVAFKFGNYRCPPVKE